MHLPPARARHDVVDGLAVVRRRYEHPAPHGPAVVLVHGAMDRAASFGRVMRRLGDLDVTAYDRRGYAGSLGAGVAPTIAAHAADLAAVSRWTGAERVVVVGHSLGGTIALGAAALAPPGDEPAAVGLFESPVPSLPGYRSDAADLALAAAADRGAPAAAECFFRLLVGDRAWERLRAADRGTRLAEGEALVAELTDLRRTGAVVDPRTVDVAVAVGAGGTSAAPLRESAAALAAALPGSPPVDTIAGAGHGAHLTHPDEFARWVRRCVALA
jgi:pimeloyl-ACP methyl ester carboxylesterase